MLTNNLCVVGLYFCYSISSMMKLMRCLSRRICNWRTFCVCFLCVFGIVIVCYQWLLPQYHAEQFNTLQALNILNAVESNASWILTFSSDIVVSSSSMDHVRKAVNVPKTSHISHNRSGSSVSYNANSKSDFIKVFNTSNYVHDGLPSQNISRLSDVNRSSAVSQLSAESQPAVRKSVMLTTFMLRPGSNHELSVQQTIRDMNRKSLASGLVNVVAMSLYGSELRYTAGVVRNAQLLRQNFPGWQLWVYVESPSSSKFPPVPEDVISRLVSVGAEVHYISPEDDMIPPMMWRFLVADDAAVDWFIVRDADSRLTRRDAAAVAAWVQSDRSFHCVRDHPSHAAYAVSGGLWGGRAPHLRLILRRSWANMMHGVAAGYQNDMNFLNGVIWPRVERHAYCVDSVSCDHWPNAFPFPVARRGYEHIGQVYDEHDTPRNGDVQILKHTLENRNCIPLSETE